jgi:hypothetical protein
MANDFTKAVVNLINASEQAIRLFEYRGMDKAPIDSRIVTEFKKAFEEMVHAKDAVDAGNWDGKFQR